MSVILETSCGNITVDLYVKERPRCCLNFLKLCKIKYYNFSLFHSVQRNLAAQTGDPDGNGKGGKSVFSLLYGEQAAYFEAETLPRIKHKKFGTVSMVNGGNGVHGSQFFLTLAPNIDYLDSQNHTVFGEVAEGFEVLNMFNETIVDSNNQPYKDIRIFHTVVLDDPFEDPQGLEKYIPDRSPSPSAERLKGGRIGVDEEIDDEKGLTAEEIDQRYKEKEAKANAQILEMVGDIPDVDVKPPDNVLFVCKLNPVTTSEDLEIIFSRFGTILSCEVIRDQKTKDSLQYAFIEFEKPEDCEKAYFKMDNVLIDDRRIHVDFSQSVSKLRWNPKEKGRPDAKKDDDEERTQLRIKHPDDRRNTKYDLVFEEIDSGKKRKRRSKSKEKHTQDKHKKHHKQRRNHSPSSERDSTSTDRRKILDVKKDHKRSHRERSPVSSNEQGKQKRRRDKSSSEERTKHKHKRKHRSHSSSYEERTTTKDKKRCQSPSRVHEEKSKCKERSRRRSNSSSSGERTKVKHHKKHESKSRFSSTDGSKDHEKKPYRNDSASSTERSSRRQNRRSASSSPDHSEPVSKNKNDVYKGKTIDSSREHKSKRKEKRRRSSSRKMSRSP